MTVCIAALCTWPRQPGQDEQLPLFRMVVGAADRMLTAEADAIQYEAPVQKIYQLSRFCVAMVSGDSGIQATLVARTLRTVTDRYNLEDVAATIPIEEVAEIYADHFSEYRKALAARRILAPLGLTMDSFIARQRQLQRGIAGDLAEELRTARLGCRAIITGHDLRLPFHHIYVVSDPGRVSCADREGFAAIGIGSRHAESQFMFAKYSPETHVGEALLLAYSAKKHAQTAPGVGPFTDIMFVGPRSWGLLLEREKNGLDEIYRRSRTVIDRANRSAGKRSRTYVEALINAPRPPQPPEGGQIPPPAPGARTPPEPTT